MQLRRARPLASNGSAEHLCALFQLVRRRNVDVETASVITDSSEIFMQVLSESSLKGCLKCSGLWKFS